MHRALPPHPTRILFAVVFVLLALIVLDQRHVWAADYSVTNTDDHGENSLRWAITEANKSAGPHTITFVAGLSGTITLESPLPSIIRELTIEGPGADVLGVSGDGLYRIFTIDAGPVTISGLTLRDGYAANPDWDGGAIAALDPNYLYDVELNLHGVVVRNCRADRYGGGIFLYSGRFEISSSTILSNAAVSHGGGIYLGANTFQPADLVIADSGIFSNTAGGQGGGIYANSGDISVDLRPGVALHHNQAEQSGGGARIESPGGGFTTRFVITATETAVHDNEAGGDGGGLSIAPGDMVTATLSGLAIYSNRAGGNGGGLSVSGMACSADSPVMISATEIYSNVAAAAGSGQGGGLYFYYCQQAKLTVTAGKIHHNSVQGFGSGGGAALGAVTALFSATSFQENSAALNGGALHVSGSDAAVTAVHGCIVGNSDTAVVRDVVPVMNATDNWWGAPSGPSGAGPGSGDSLSDHVDFGGYKTAPPPLCQPIIDMAKTAVGIPKPDDVVTYTLILSNSGLIADNAVRITDTLPVHTTFLDWLEWPVGANVAGGRLTWAGAVVPTSVMTFSLRTKYIGHYSEVVANTVDFAGTYTSGQRSAVFVAQHLLTVINDGVGSGEVSSTPGGIACGADCTESFVPATVVTLTAAPQAESVFIGWTGACIGANAACVLVMDASKTTTATFSLLHDLTVQKAGDGSGVVTLTPPIPGVTCGAGCIAITRTYMHNDLVTVTAVADSGSVFTGWTGACTGLDPCQVTVDGDKTLIASFRQLLRLTVHKAGSGGGGVGSTPAGIACGATCAAFFAPETVVTLTATADISSTFGGWSGVCVGLGDACVATMQSATDVTATFTLKQWPLIASKASGGQGNVNLNPPNVDCDAACTAITQTYDHGAVVTLTATAAPGFAFGGWLEDCAMAGNNPVCNVTMTAVRSAAASFLDAYRLTVGKEGNGGGQVGSSDGGINCGAACSADYVAGTVVTLNAQAAPGSNFAAWRGDCASANPSASCQIAIDAAKVVTATFNLNHYVLRLTKTGSGVVNVAPPDADCGAGCTVLEETYDHGTVVTLIAQADVGFVFAGWGEACAGFGVNPVCTVTMDAAKNAAATFVVRTFQLRVDKFGTGRVYGGPPSGAPAIDCGPTCQQVYNDGVKVTLHATPDSGQVFGGWMGACIAPAPAPCVITMDADKAVIARFGQPGTLRGTVLVTDTAPARVTVTAEKLTEDGWQWAANVLVDLPGSARSADALTAESAVTTSASYVLSGLYPGTYRVSFSDENDNYRSEYYNDVPFGTPAAANMISVTVNNTIGLRDATLSPAVAARSEMTAGTGTITVDPNTGLVIVVQPRAEPSDVVVRFTPECPPGGGNPTDVALRYGGGTLPMIMNPPGSGTYVGRIPGASVEDNTEIVGSFSCRGLPPITVTLGSVQLYDPSGIVTDAVTGQPVTDAQVVLFRIPGWRPDVSGETRECRTVDTRNGDTWDNEPAADVHLGAVLNGTTDAGLMSPDVNPQRTDAAGRYGWDVAEGCYYVLVTAAGYEERVSPIVGVPPAVTDLDLKLTPLPVSVRSLYLPIVNR